MLKYSNFILIYLFLQYYKSKVTSIGLSEKTERLFFHCEKKGGCLFPRTVMTKTFPFLRVS